MNIFAGNIVVSKESVLSKIPYDYIANLSATGERVVFVFGETGQESSEAVVSELTQLLWEISQVDISHSTEEKLDILNTTYEEGIYELASFEGENVSYGEIKDRFEDFEEAVCVREAEISKKFGTKIIRVDFVY